ncbi:CinA family protein [Conexibacter sp. SYSU D00693]|uniref:CinA family protein n=1 Tax=Conexibacter sp. SYSU D00693 TaxID=2812560 RepID=UPI00196B256D|nr:CinA family protein [Conexibacter sp. SYSU D00693]
MAPLPTTLTEPAAAVAQRLEDRGETLALAESSGGGLVTAALIAVPGASAFHRGGVVIYTLGGAKALLADARPLDEGVRSASEPFAVWLASAVATKLRADWGFGETGASGPTGNPYGDPAGHSWLAVHGPDGPSTRHVLTGDDDRAANMEAFAAAGLALLLDRLG